MVQTDTETVAPASRSNVLIKRHPGPNCPVVLDITHNPGRNDAVAVCCCLIIRTMEIHPEDGTKDQAGWKHGEFFGIKISNQLCLQVKPVVTLLVDVPSRRRRNNNLLLAQAILGASDKPPVIIEPVEKVQPNSEAVTVIRSGCSDILIQFLIDKSERIHRIQRRKPQI